MPYMEIIEDIGTNRHLCGAKCGTNRQRWKTSRNKSIKVEQIDGTNRG